LLVIFPSPFISHPRVNDMNFRILLKVTSHQFPYQSTFAAKQLKNLVA
jgi:hypothetical protein